LAQPQDVGREALAHLLQLRPAGRNSLLHSERDLFPEFRCADRVPDLLDHESFDGVGGHGPGPLATAPSVVARALLRSGGGSAQWHDLDQAAYDHLVATASQYDIFADELTRSVTKGRGKNRKQQTGVKLSYFTMIRAGADRRSNFDPATDGPSEEGVSGKQIFQRARKAIDLGSGNTWALFKTDLADNHATYRFDPDTSVTFALVFAPKP